MKFTLEDIDLAAQELVQNLQGGSVVVLVGDMGAGKTTLVKACAKALGVLDEITSPTFSIVEDHECESSHPSIKRLIHVDTYRIEFENEIYDLGLENLFDEDALTFIEWGERIENLIEGSYQVWNLDEQRDGSRLLTIENRSN